MMKIKRSFFSGPKGCNNGCGYCFLHWSCRPAFASMPSILRSNGSVIVYPICDSELNQQDVNIWLRIERCLEKNPKCIVSISTKDEWQEESLDRLDMIRQKVGASRIKLSVSITSKSLVKEIEPEASTYDSRIGLLQRLTERGICHSVMLKPLLPFISCNEYCEIVNDASDVCKDFVTGDLYVDQTTFFFIKYILGRYKVEKRKSAWMNRYVDYVKHPQELDIIHYIQSCKLNWYQSDEDFLLKHMEK